MLHPLFPAQADNRFEGHRASLWLLWLLVALMLIVSIRSILDTEAVAAGADGLPLASLGPAAARTVLMLFALDAVGTLIFALITITVLIRYRALVPFIYLILVGGQIARRFVIQAYAVPRTEGSVGGWYLVAAILGVLILGLALSLLRRRPATS